MAAKLQRDPWTTPTQGKQLPFYVGGPNQYPRAQQPQQNFDPNSDIQAIFEGMRQNRGMVRRGMSGEMLNPDGSDPGSGFNQFIRNNPHLATPELRQQQYARENQQRYDNINQQGAAAVDFMKQTKGYSDQNGNFVPPTMPSEPSSRYGTGSVSFTDKPTRGVMTDPLTGKPVYMNEYLPQQELVQNTKYGPEWAQEAARKDYFGGPAMMMPGQIRKAEKLLSKVEPKAPAEMDAIFPSGGAQQISPPGGGVPGRVGAGMLPGEPGGGTMPQKPEFKMPVVNYQFDKQISDFYAPPKPKLSDPFTGLPTTNELTPDQLEVINMFAPVDTYWKQQDANMPPAQRPIYGKPKTNTINVLDVLTSWPFISDKGVESLANYWPGYDWSLKDTPRNNMERIQSNFNDLVAKGLLDYQLAGQRPHYVDSPKAPGARKMFKPKVIPQTKEEKSLAEIKNIFK